MSMLSKKYSFLMALLLVANIGFSQPMEDEYGYFLFPIKPGVRNTLSGTMGELRSSHFHTGIDIRTGGQEGLAVVAAADGYISRIKVSPGGYGNALYMMHPNGKTTVYAHLKSFNPAIEKYVKDAQYKNESFEVNLFPDRDTFKFKQGDTLALSGNSGSSGGPHLHFDLRDENQNLLNPLKYGFPEVVDTRAPYAKSVALVPFTTDSRIEGQFDRTEFTLVASGSHYTLPDTIHALGNIGLELYAWDRMNGTRFKTGIIDIHVQVNDEETFGQHINTWSFSRARSFYQHISYPTLVSEGKRYHKLYLDNGNTLRFYNPVANKGLLTIEPGKYYNVTIALKDSYGNKSKVKLVIYGNETSPKETNTRYQAPSLSINRHTLKITGDSLSDNEARLVVNKKTISIKPAYLTAAGQPVYLWDLAQQAIPEAIELNDTTLYPHIISMVPPGKEYKVFNQYADILFARNSLFDTLYFTFDHEIDTTLNLERIRIGNETIPLKGNITVSLKPTLPVNRPEKAGVYAVYGKNKYSYAGGKWKESQMEFKTRNFGVYTILEDTLAPRIKPLIINKDKIVFKLDDEQSGLKTIRASLNGKWLLIAKDPKKKLYWAEKHYPEDNFAGEFKLEVTDNANNTKIYTTKIR